MKVAMASSDGIMVNQHFGRAETFYIYDVEDDVSFVEKRRGKPFCHGGTHEDEDLLDAVTLLSDCKRVYVLNIGGGAKEVLAEKNIEAVVSRGFIEEVLGEFAREKNIS